MKKNKILLAVLALVMALGLGIGSAMAYFTTYVTAKGGMPIRLGDKTELDEKFDGKKHLVVTNNGINPVFVRARAIVPNKYRPKNEESMYENASKNGPWTYNEKDGYCYYGIVLPGIAPDETDESTEAKEARSTSELIIAVKDILPEDRQEGDEVNIVVIYESTPVLYDEDGNPYADWTQTVKVEEGGNS